MELEKVWEAFKEDITKMSVEVSGVRRRKTEVKSTVG